MDNQTLQRRQAPRPVPPSQGAAVAGPGQARMSAIAAGMNAAVAQRFAAITAAPVQRAPAKGGLPDRLKAGVEALSGLSMDHVRVHRNSSRPAQLDAHAYAQGTDIHLAPGQERHLPHEAWHVVQQAQGRVRPTRTLAGQVSINDDSQLEHQADAMGRRAIQLAALPRDRAIPAGAAGATQRPAMPRVSARKTTGTVQAKAISAQTLGGQDNGTATLFDAPRLREGKSIIKTETISEGQQYIPAYQEGIIEAHARVTAAAAPPPLRYTDYDFPNFAANPPSDANWPPDALATEPLLNLFVAGGVTMIHALKLNEAAINNLFIGKTNKAQTVAKLREFWIARDTLTNRPGVGLIDPFQYTLRIEKQLPEKSKIASKKAPKRSKPEAEITTQFSFAGNGYITRIVIGDHEIAGHILSAADFTATHADPREDDEDFAYSSTHIQGAPYAGGETYGDQHKKLATGAADTIGAKHLALDAATVIAAEGARFQPVRWMGNALKPTTRFYCDDPANTAQVKNIRYVTTVWLYTNWGVHFGSEYNISFETMIDVVGHHGIQAPKTGRVGLQ